MTKARAAIYARISADPEGRAVGVQRQEADCRALADRLGLEVVDVVVDNDVSASTNTTKSRPAYAALLERARRGEVAAILSYSNSRLTRRPREFEDLLELGREAGTRIATVVSGEDDLSTADGRMVARFKAVADAAEAERTAERVKRAKADAAARGAYRGGPRPVGYEPDGLTVRPSEAGPIAEATRGIVEGLSVLEVTRRLTAAGVRTSTGKQLDGVAVRRLLLRPRNAGLLERGGEVVGRAQWPAIVEEDVWRSAVAVLSDPARRTQRGSQPAHLLSKIARCAACEQTLVAATYRGTPTYVCPSRHVSRVIEALDRYVVAVVEGRLAQPDVAELLAPPDDSGDRLREARLAVRTIEEREAELGRLFADGTIGGAALASGTASLREQRQVAERTLATVADAARLGWLAGAPSPVEAFREASLERRRGVVRELLDVTVQRSTRRGRAAGVAKGQLAEPETIDLTWRGAS